MNRRERRAAGRKPQAESRAADVSTPAALYAAGLGHMRAGRYLDAQMCCEKALSLDPDHADTLHLTGLLSIRAQQYDLAVEWIARAIRLDPKPIYLSSLGTTLRQQGRYDEALKTFEKTLQLAPDDAELWSLFGHVLSDLDRPDDAILALQRALKLKPGHWAAANQSALLFNRLERFEEALAHFNLCDEVKPNRALTLHARALALQGLKRFEESLADNLRAHALNPADPLTCNNTGNALLSLGRQEEALGWFDRALALRPGFEKALHNKCNSLTELYRFDEAFEIYHGLQRTGASAETEWNLSLLQLLHGNFEAGWAGREARWRMPSHYVHSHFSQPKWLGRQSIEGKTVLIYGDEGLGDSINFARYVPMVAARGARVILVVADPVYPLLSGLAGISECRPLSAGIPPAFDLYCPMTSLPLAFGTRLDTIPSGTSCLPQPPETRIRAWEERLGPHDRLRVGLVWSGNPAHKNDRNRSMPLEALSRLLDADATFVSLQKQPKADDKVYLGERTTIIDLTDHLTDFVETAALVCCLDLVVTVDTSVAHLAASLGCPTWILLPYVPDFRWLLDRDDSPWYPTVRLFRQTETRDYASVLDRVQTALQTLISAS
jgi:tetratricopeptide (TPR) repeat protein